MYARGVYVLCILVYICVCTFIFMYTLLEFILMYLCIATNRSHRDHISDHLQCTLVTLDLSQTFIFMAFDRNYRLQILVASVTIYNILLVTIYCIIYQFLSSYVTHYLVPVVSLS